MTAFLLVPFYIFCGLYNVFSIHPATATSLGKERDCMHDLISIINTADQNELKLILANVEQKLAEKGAMTPLRHPGGALSSVPDGTKHLSPQELEQATAAFTDWCKAAKNPVQQRSRNRLWVAFLLIRYGAMRLGEVLALNDRTDLDRKRCLVLVRGANAREVLLPDKVMAAIAELFESPMFYSLRGQVLNLDPGYLRRKFYERAKDCGLPVKLFNPRVIRHSRAIELLQGGGPLQVVRSFIGQQNLNMTAHYLEFSEQTTQRIVQQYITRETKMKTSARNSFTGTVSAIKRDGLLVEVHLTTLAGLVVVAVITEESFKTLRLEEGSAATAIVKAPWVILAAADSGNSTQSTARNRFSGKVQRIKASAIAAEVTVLLKEGTTVCALVTEESVRTLDLKPGNPVQVLFKAFSVILNVE